MTKATSFVGEHTVELALAPILKSILLRDFEFVTPIFPWMTREGGNMSKSIHQNDKFKILGLYPRRPKINTSDEENIYLKVNEQIISGAKTGLKLGIPIIAGYPKATSIWELGKTPDCLWFQLNFDSNESREFPIKLEKSIITDCELSNMIFQKDEEILEYVEKEAKVHDINSAIDAFRKIKMNSVGAEHYSTFTFMGGYKPIYFLLK